MYSLAQHLYVNPSSQLVTFQCFYLSVKQGTYVMLTKMQDLVGSLWIILYENIKCIKKTYLYVSILSPSILWNRFWYSSEILKFYTAVNITRSVQLPEAFKLHQKNAIKADGTRHVLWGHKLLQYLYSLHNMIVWKNWLLGTMWDKGTHWIVWD